MVFSSVPLYLDPPNWQQHPNQQLHGNNNNGNHENQHLMPQIQVPQPQPQVGMGGSGGAGGQQIRPNSMAERARMAKMPPPEAPQKCPRCDSTNTKFCYFNNYSLSQPRHFCKTCRRYWTRGGALRNVPVGGGCRRNKRSSSKSSSGGGGGGSGPSSSKSSLSSSSIMGGGGDQRHGLDLVSSSGINISPTMGVIHSGSVGGIGGGMSFMASLQNIAQLGGMANMGLTFGGSLHGAPSHSLGGLGGLGGGSSAGDGNDQHQLDFPQLNHSHQQVQFPNFLGGFEIPGSTTSSGGGLYSSSFQNDHQGVSTGDDEQMNMSKSSAMMSSQLAPVKMEDHGRGLNLAKQLMGISSSSDNATGNQYWGGGSMTSNNAAANTSMWTDLSGLNSSSTSQLL